MRRGLPPARGDGKTRLRLPRAAARGCRVALAKRGTTERRRARRGLRARDIEWDLRAAQQAAARKKQSLKSEGLMPPGTAAPARVSPNRARLRNGLPRPRQHSAPPTYVCPPRPWRDPFSEHNWFANLAYFAAAPLPQDHSKSRHGTATVLLKRSIDSCGRW